MRGLICFLLLSILTIQASAHEGEVHETPEKPAKPSVQKPRITEAAKTVTLTARGQKGAYNLTFTVKPGRPLVNMETQIEVKITMPLPKPDPLLGTEMPVEEATVTGKFIAKGYVSPPITAHSEEESGVYGIHTKFEKPGHYELQLSVKTGDDSFSIALPLQVNPLPGTGLAQKVDLVVLILGVLLVAGGFALQMKKGRTPGNAFVGTVPLLVGILVAGGAIIGIFHGLVAPRLNAPYEESAGASLPQSRTSETVQVPVELQKLLEIKTTVVKSTVLESSLVVPGKVTASPERVHDIHPPVIGRVESLAHIPTVGEQVREGQILAFVVQTLTAPEQLQIQTQNLELQRQITQARAQLAQSRTRLALREKELNRARKLYEIQALALKDLELAEAEHKSALLGFQEALRQDSLYRSYERSRKSSPPLRRFPVVSPISGIVTNMDITRGELVHPEKRIFTLMDLSLVWVQAQIQEKDLARVHVRDRADITVAAFPKHTFYGRLKTLGSVVDPQSRTVQAIFEIPNQRGELRDGMFAMVHLKAPSRTVTAVPVSSVVEEEGKSFVFVREGDTRFRRRPVTLGERVGEVMEITRGLSPGVTVVTEGAHSLAAQARKPAKTDAQ